MISRQEHAVLDKLKLREMNEENLISRRKAIGGMGAAWAALAVQ
jgi:hypothetical protein